MASGENSLSSEQPGISFKLLVAIVYVDKHLVNRSSIGDSFLYLKLSKLTSSSSCSQ